MSPHRRRRGNRSWPLTWSGFWFVVVVAIAVAFVVAAARAIAKALPFIS